MAHGNRELDDENPQNFPKCSPWTMNSRGPNGYDGVLLQRTENPMTLLLHMDKHLHHLVGG